MINEKKEKLIIYFSISIIVIIFVIIIILIWSPTFKKFQNSDINTYDDTVTYEEIMNEYYTKYLNNYLNITNFDILYDKIDKDYILSLNIEDTKENVKNYLRDNGLISSDINVVDIDYTTDGEVNIFRVLYTSHNLNKYVNIKENDPYNFTITFEQQELNTLISKNYINANINSVIYNVEVVSSDDKSIRYRITIENNSNDEYVFDFSALNSVQLVYDESNYINMAAIANSSDVNYNLSPGSTKMIEILFNLSFSNQVKVNKITLNDVYINNKKSKIDLNF